MKSPKVLTKSQNLPPTECVSTLVSSRTPAADYLMQIEDYDIETINDARWIPLTRGIFAIVDREDYSIIMQNKWLAIKGKYTYYAARRISLKNLDGTRDTINVAMHRQIMNALDGWEVDHRNHNGLDNRKCNLRICTHAQNAHNSRKTDRSNRTSIFKGVSETAYYKRTKKGKRWSVIITHRDIKIYLGSFDSEIDAAKAYDAKALELFGEFAYTNF